MSNRRIGSALYTFIITVIFIQLLGCGGGGDGDGGSVDGGTTSPETVTAGEMSQLYGVGSYDFHSADQDAGMGVTVYDLDGSNLGEVTLSVGPGAELISEYVRNDNDNTSINVNIEDPYDGSIEPYILMEVTGGGQTILVRTTPGDSPQLVQRVQLQTQLSSSTTLPSLGTLDTNDSGTQALLTIVDNGTVVVTVDDVKLWFTQVGLNPLYYSSSVAELMSVLQDPALHDWWHARIDEAVPTVTGVHLNPECSWLKEGAVSLTVAACTTCVLTLKASLIPGLTPWAAVGFLASCSACVTLGPASVLNFAVCWDSYKNKWTNSRCVNEWASLPENECEWGDPLAGAWEHSCWCSCNADNCAGYCSRIANGKGIDLLASAGSCSNGQCICNYDPESFCKASDLGTAYCGGATIDPSTGNVSCPTSVCRNATVDRSCGITTRNEVCDPLATPNGCPQGQRCSDDCGSCIDACPDGICDPAIGEDQPSSPNYCLADCSSAACGDGVCQSGQGELDSNSPSYCPQDCSVGVDCCTQNFGCPTEGFYTCEGSPCCCCPWGQHCVGNPQGGWACGN